MPTQPDVVVVGAGWAGLAAGVELAHRGLSVRILESARQTGGRGRRVESGGLQVDNGQHLLIGAYRESLRLLARVGVEESEVLLRMPLHLAIRDGERPLDLRAAPLPAPLHLGVGLLRASGLSARQRLAAARMAYRLRRRRFTLSEPCSVSRLLALEGQDPDLVRRLWEPLNLAALNTPGDRASAQVFVNVLRDAFFGRRTDADFLIPRVGLDRLFPAPAAAFIERRGGRIESGRKVVRLLVEKGRISGVETASGERISAGQVILAVPPTAAARLMQPHRGLAETAGRLERFAYEPITTVYLRYSADTRLPVPMLGLLGTRTHWVFDRAVCGQPGLLAAVISAAGPHGDMDRRQLLETVGREVSSLLPNRPQPDGGVVIREKRATFACDVQSEVLRPEAATPVAGLWLAGDYTATGYPATLEGAVRSGVQCAGHIGDNAAPS